MRLSESKKTPLTITIVLALLLSLVGIIAVLIWDFASKINRGWTNSDTIQYVLIVLVLVAGTGTDKALFEYYVHRDKDLLVLNNNIFRAFSKLEETKKIKDFKNYLVDKENEKYMRKIDKIFLKCGVETKISKDNILDYFDTNGWVKDNYHVDSKRQFKLLELFEKVTKNESVQYERMYQEFHGGLLLKQYKFPFFEIIVPLFLGILGLLVSSYQVLLLDGSIKDSLFDYIKLFAEFLGILILWSCRSYRPAKEGLIDKKQKQLEDMIKFLK